MNAATAIKTAKRTNQVAIRIDGINKVIDRAEAYQLEESGTGFSYLGEAPDIYGRWHIVSVPVEARFIS